MKTSQKKRRSHNRRLVAKEERSRKRGEVTVDDVIAALLDLFGQLQIDAPQLASRVRHVNKDLTSEPRLYSHTATIGELLTAWHQNPDYLDQIGSPLPLKMRGNKRSFASLAAEAVPSMSASALLGQLKRVGAVSVDASGYIRVQMRSLSVYEDRQLAVDHTLTSLLGFIRTLHHNLGSDVLNSDQLFHRVVWSDTLDRSLLPNLKIRLRRQGQHFLESFDSWMMRRTNKHIVSSKKMRPTEVSIGIYLAVGQDKAHLRR